MAHVSAGTWRPVHGAGPRRVLFKRTIHPARRCGVAVNGSVWCQGQGAYGQLGQGSTANSPGVLVKVNSTQTFKAVNLGSYVTCALTFATNRLFCWGRNDMSMVRSLGRVYFSAVGMPPFPQPP